VERDGATDDAPGPLPVVLTSTAGWRSTSTLVRCTSISTAIRLLHVGHGGDPGDRRSWVFASRKPELISEVAHMVVMALAVGVPI